MRTRVPGSRTLAATLASALLLSAVMLYGAGPVAAQGYGSSGATPAPTASSAPMQVALTLRSAASLGTFLTGPDGMTLYTLSSDPAGGSVCTAKCLTIWPPLTVAAGGSASATGTSAVFGTFVRSDTGATQVTVGGRALYYYQGDTAAGQTNGEGIPALGGVWHVAAVTAAAVAAASSASPGAASMAPTDVTPVTGNSPTTGPLVLLLVIVLALAAALTFMARQARRR